MSERSLILRNAVVLLSPLIGLAAESGADALVPPCIVGSRLFERVLDISPGHKILELDGTTLAKRTTLGKSGRLAPTAVPDFCRSHHAI